MFDDVDGMMYQNSRHTLASVINGVASVVFVPIWIPNELIFVTA